MASRDKSPKALDSEQRALLRGALGLSSPHDPFPWQERLLATFIAEDEPLPTAIDLPTGLGKTSTMAIWLVARMLGHGKTKLPRRLVYIVDRRAVVDQATIEAERLCTWVEQTEGVSQALGVLDGASLPVSTLRGQHIDNRKWLARPDQPAIIVGTVDMIGSRLLFAGYGVSRKMRPYHAGLLGHDTLFLLDEAHLVPPFEQLLRAVTQRRDALGLGGSAPAFSLPPARLLSLSATQRGSNEQTHVFSLDDADREHPVVHERLTAPKRLSVQGEVATKKLPEALAQAAVDLIKDEPSARILVFANSRDVAEKAENRAQSLLHESLGKPKRGEPERFKTELLVGARRVHERVEAQQELETMGFLAGSKASHQGPALVFATSAGEVGIDLDAHHMVADLVSWERMVQRLGRVNRRGKHPANVVIIPEAKDKATEREVAVRRAVEELLSALPDHNGSPEALVELSNRRATDPAIDRAWQAALTQAPYYPLLDRPVVEAWALTSLAEHTGRPEVGPWIRGWIDEEPQTTVVWRKHLPRTKGMEKAGVSSALELLFEAAPPHLEEKLETQTSRVKSWLVTIAKRVAQAKQPSQANLTPDTVVLVLLEGAHEPTQYWTLEDLADLDHDQRYKDRLVRELAGCTLVLHAELGGLSELGLLDPNAGQVPWTPEMNPETPLDISPTSSVQWTSRVVPPNVKSETPDGWRPITRITLEVDRDGAPQHELEILRWKTAPTHEDGRGIARTVQELSEHQAWAKARARTIAENLRLPNDATRMLEEAAVLHDEGKAAACWQRAFNAPTDKIYAKTRGPVNIHALAGYRHELGSLTQVEASEGLAQLGPTWHQLALHLVAAHHGNARPTITTSGFDALPPSLVKARARDVALRYFEVQTNWGPWGLAWLEALLRAADAWASQDLENEGKSS